MTWCNTLLPQVQKGQQGVHSYLIGNRLGWQCVKEQGGVLNGQLQVENDRQSIQSSLLGK